MTVPSDPSRLAASRRRWLRLAPVLAAAAAASPGSVRSAGVSASGGFPGEPVEYPIVRRDAVLSFPRDHGSHDDYRIEWWYLTGWLFDRGDRTPRGFQLTFFRIRTAYPRGNPSRFTPGRLMAAHAALVDTPSGRHLQRDRLANLGAAGVRLSVTDTDCALPGWTLARGDDDRYRTGVREDEFGWRLTLSPPSPAQPWLQGDRGFSRKGPEEAQASHYYSRTQLRIAGELDVAGRSRPVEGIAWLDHEWSSTLLDPRAAGWDWAGLNLLDGRSLVWFRVRLADSDDTLWSYLALREADGRVRVLESAAVTIDDTWTSGATGSRYPVAVTLAPEPAPAGLTRLRLRPLIPNQEIDSRGSTGNAYWEGAVRVLDGGDREVGLGYLELTGYHRAMRL